MILPENKRKKYKCAYGTQLERKFMFCKFVDGCLLYFSLAERTLRIMIPLEFSESLTHRTIQKTKHFDFINKITIYPS